LTVTDSCTSGANAAVTVRAASICTVHVVCNPLHALPQPVNAYPLCGAAVSVMVEFGGSGASHVEPAPHEMPPPVTVPPPLTVTVRACDAVLTKFALAVAFAPR